MKKRSVRDPVKDRHPQVESNGWPGPGHKLGNLPFRPDRDRPSPALQVAMTFRILPPSVIPSRKIWSGSPAKTTLSTC